MTQPKKTCNGISSSAFPPYILFLSPDPRSLHNRRFPCILNEWLFSLPYPSTVPVVLIA
jgi:hypothetical protein